MLVQRRNIHLHLRGIPFLKTKAASEISHLQHFGSPGTESDSTYVPKTIQWRDRRDPRREGKVVGTELYRVSTFILVLSAPESARSAKICVTRGCTNIDKQNLAWSLEIWEGDCEEETETCGSAFRFRFIFGEAAIEKVMGKDVKHIRGIFGVDASAAGLLLRHMSWNKERWPLGPPSPSRRPLGGTAASQSRHPFARAAAPRPSSPPSASVLPPLPPSPLSGSKSFPISIRGLEPPAPCDDTWSGDFDGFAADYTAYAPLVSPSPVPSPPRARHTPFPAHALPTAHILRRGAGVDEGDWEECDIPYDYEDVLLSPFIACAPSPSSENSPAAQEDAEEHEEPELIMKCTFPSSLMPTPGPYTGWHPHPRISQLHAALTAAPFPPSACPLPSPAANAGVRVARRVRFLLFLRPDPLDHYVVLPCPPLTPAPFASVLFGASAPFLLSPCSPVPATPATPYSASAQYAAYTPSSSPALYTAISRKGTKFVESRNGTFSGFLVKHLAAGAFYTEFRIRVSSRCTLKEQRQGKGRILARIGSDPILKAAQSKPSANKWLPSNQITRISECRLGVPRLFLSRSPGPFCGIPCANAVTVSAVPSQKPKRPPVGSAVIAVFRSAVSSKLSFRKMGCRMEDQWCYRRPMSAEGDVVPATDLGTTRIRGHGGGTSAVQGERGKREQGEARGSLRLRTIPAEAAALRVEKRFRSSGEAPASSPAKTKGNLSIYGYFKMFYEAKLSKKVREIPGMGEVIQHAVEPTIQSEVSPFKDSRCRIIIRCNEPNLVLNGSIGCGKKPDKPWLI
ncbi:hypothetical protein B0H11DRAFT_1931238 [Mycena galericulata]|nr:hypothetical protein B0H11DRAFT_1931238 [Mycena galericulata]